MGRPKTPLRELVRAVLEVDPEISVAELEERFPKYKQIKLRAALYRERADLGITEWRQEVSSDSVTLGLVLPRKVYEQLRNIAEAGRVGRTLAKVAAEIASKKSATE
ncbi:MAG: hypothetical protein KC636_32760 [Myxococcales bacterium]|nr:hypothetical protein [Myxococcales bacterium]